VLKYALIDHTKLVAATVRWFEAPHGVSRVTLKETAYKHGFLRHHDLNQYTIFCGIFKVLFGLSGVCGKR